MAEEPKNEVVVQQSREEVSLAAVRANWPLITAMIIGLIAWTETRMTVQHILTRQEGTAQMLSHEAFAEFAAWKALTSYKIEQLEKQPLSCPSH